MNTRYENVIRAWYESRPYHAGDFHTTGSDLKYYDHQIGYTINLNGIKQKVVEDCHQSSVTQAFVNLAKRVATKVVACHIHPQGNIMPQDSPGTKDGTTCADNDKPYSFGAKLTCANHFPFTELQFGKLMVLRARIQNGELTGDTSVDV